MQCKDKGILEFKTHFKKKHGILDKQEYNLYLELKEKDPSELLEQNEFVDEDDSREERVEEHFHNKPNCENDESEEENALESAKYETQDPFNDIGHIMLEPTVEINMTEEDSDDVPDLELFEPSVETNTDENAEPEKNQEHKAVHLM